MIKNILTTFGSMITTALFSFIVFILTIQYLGAEGRGIISLITASVGLINLSSGFIGGAALIYLIPKNKNKTFFTHVFILSYIWALVSSAIITPGLGLTQSIPADVVIHTFFIGLLMSLSTLHKIILIALEKIFLQNIVSVIPTLLNLLIFGGSIFFFSIVSVDLFILSLYAAYTISSVASLLFVIRYLPEENGENTILNSFREISRFGFINQMNNLIQYLNYRLSYYILNYYTSVASVGIYSVGVVISETVWMISGSIALVQYSRITNRDDLNYARELTLRLAKLSFIATLPVAALLLLTPYDIFVKIFGKDFQSVKEILSYLLPGICVFSYTMMLGQFFAGIGKYITNTKATFLGLMVTLVFNFALVPRYGYVGAAITASLSYIITGLFLVYSFARETGISLEKFFLDKEDINYALWKVGLGVRKGVG